MMTRFRLLFTLFIFISLPLTTAAQENDIDQIFEATTIPQILEEVPKDLHQQFSQNPFGISADNNARLMELFSETFSADSLTTIAKSHFVESFDLDLAASALEALQDESIKPILKTESEFYTVQGTRQQIVTKHELEQSEPSGERQAIIKKLIQNSSAKERELESQTIILRSLVTAAGSISPNLALTEGQIDGIVNNFSNQMERELDNMLVENYMVMYHGVDNEELKKYADFYATDAGTEFKNTIAESIHKAFKEAADNLINSVESR